MQLVERGIIGLDDSVADILCVLIDLARISAEVVRPNLVNQTYIILPRPFSTGRI